MKIFEKNKEITKHDLILFIKSYKLDFDSVKKLLASIKKHNIDNIPVYLSVNDNDFEYFKNNLAFDYVLLKDSVVVPCTITDPWRYQQVIKSSMHRLNICKNYLAIDSDSVFITDFYIKDFIYKDSIPYTVMHESKSYLEAMEQINRDSSTVFFKEATLETRKLLAINDTERIWDYGPSPYIWSTKVWSEIAIFLQKKGFTFETFLMEISKKTSPSENAIYGEFLRVNKTIEIVPIGPLFKVYHYKEQYQLEKKNHNIDVLKKIYLGVIFQSNWRKKSFFSFLKWNK